MYKFHENRFPFDFYQRFFKCSHEPQHRWQFLLDSRSISLLYIYHMLMQKEAFLIFQGSW